MTTPSAPAELYTHRPGSDARFAPLTTLNKDLLGKKKVAEIEAFTFRSFDGREIEAFLTKPATLDAARAPAIR